MILITGPGGFVGRRLMQALPQAVAAPSLRDADQEALCRLVEDSGADAIVHTAAISDTGYCQNHPEESYRANVALPLLLAKATQGRKLICFSSDQVYNGSREPGPYTEDMACPASVYAAHKLEMEQRVLDVLPTAVMLRAQWMYDLPAPRPNYLWNLIQAAGPVTASVGQYRGLTWLEDTVRRMPQVLTLPGGAYNFGCETTRSMYQITCHVLQCLGRDLPVEDGPARHNLWMDCQKAARLGIRFPDTMAALEACIDQNHLRCRRKT